jgi:putative glutamine amidotransferase
VDQRSRGDQAAEAPTAPAPVIGLCAARERGRYGDWDLATDMLPGTYVEAVQRAGAIAVMIPVAPVKASAAGDVLDLVDGLLVAGGADLESASYGEEQRDVPRDVAWRPSNERDQWEMALARVAIERGLPLLGICRGMQLLNVVCGGTLEQHLPADGGHADQTGGFVDHEVELAAGSLAARAAGAERITVRSAHHQGVAELGRGLTVSGRSVRDKIIEAIELGDHPFALGTLWHPERDPDSRIISALVQSASRRSSSSGQRATHREGSVDSPKGDAQVCSDANGSRKPSAQGSPRWQ